MISKNISNYAVSGQIVRLNPLAPFCANSNHQFVLQLDNNVAPELITWKIHDQMQGSIINGQGSDICSVTINNINNPQQFLLICKVVKCGIEYEFYKTEVIQENTVISSLTPTNATICSNNFANNISFTAQTSGTPATGFIWDFGDGSPTIQTTFNFASHSYTNFTNNNLTYTVSVQAISSCNSTLSNPATTSVTVKPQPNATITPTGKMVVSSNSTVPIVITLSNTSYGNFTCAWYFLPVGQQNPTLISTSCGTYTIQPPFTNWEGDFYVVVTNTTTSCSTVTNILTIEIDDGTCFPDCTPFGPYGINNFNITLNQCNRLQATADVLGSNPGNIISYEWGFIPSLFLQSIIGTPTMTQSPQYVVSNPGVYQIILAVTYQNSVPGSPDCKVIQTGSVLVPLIPDFVMYMACNNSNNGYALELADNSAVYGSMHVTSWYWKVNGTTVSNAATYTYNIPHGFQGTTLTMELTVANAYGNTCVIQKPIVVPQLPYADFSVLTTNPDFPNTKSCEEREVLFTNNSTPPNTLVHHAWDFGDFTTLLAFHAGKTYQINPVGTNSYPFDVILTITDQFGCTNETTKTVQIYDNELKAETSPQNYILTPSLTPCIGTPVNVSVNMNPSSSTPTSYIWHQEVNTLQLQSVPDVDVYAPGAYWVKVFDENYCYLNVNPDPAVVSFTQAVPAVIMGSPHACHYVPFVLRGPAGDNLQYAWYCDGVLTSTSKDIELSLPSGIHEIQLIVTTGGICQSTSAPFIVEVHALPSAPSVSVTPVDCPNYLIELSASGSGNVTYSWSNGQSGQTTQINHGGQYRVWVTDQYGCKNKTEVSVPFAPSTHFWRFPTGCYVFCPGNLPKYIFPPTHEMFEYWEWLFSVDGHNFDYVQPNGQFYHSHGFQSFCEPLHLNLPHEYGAGSGLYMWGLNNGLCYQQSGIMDIKIHEECCEIEIYDVRIECDMATGNYILDMAINNTTPGCVAAPYNIYIVDAVQLQPLTPITFVYPQSLAQGYQQITATFPVTQALATASTPVIVKIEILCSYIEKCYGEFESRIPRCEGDYGKSAAVATTPQKPAMKDELMLIPNPASSEVLIVYNFASGNENTHKTIHIHDIVGKQIAEIPVSTSSGSLTLQLSGYSQGLYIVESTENKRRIQTKRLIINN